MRYRVFVDGQAGTTGLKIRERLARHPYVEMFAIPAATRKDAETRRAFLNRADLAFLCLPDRAAREAVSLVDNGQTRLIDASTAHRIAPGWAYGLPELGAEWRKRVAEAGRVSVPGCHATGFALALYPLRDSGIVPEDYPVTCHSVTGYSGGGRELIAKYQAEGCRESRACPCHYALGLRHKHLPEMQQMMGLTQAPLFTPIVGGFYQGMSVAIPLFKRLLNVKATAREIQAVLASFYRGERFVKVMPFAAEAHLEDGFFDPLACNGTNRAELFVFGHDEQILILTRLDNLGKGSSGAAVQLMNIMLGLDEGLGLEDRPCAAGVER